MPTDQEWKQALLDDADTEHVINSMKKAESVIPDRLLHRSYYRLWEKGLMDIENDILYLTEVPKLTTVRQLRRKFVPRGLRRTIFSAYHSSAFAGHVGVYTTYWRMATRFWWPTMYEDVREAVVKCAHCIVANSTSHKAQQVLGRLDTDETFDMVSYDISVPGISDPRSTGSTKISHMEGKMRNGDISIKQAAITGVSSCLTSSANQARFRKIQ
jgi:hypothetical protein